MKRLVAFLSVLLLAGAGCPLFDESWDPPRVGSPSQSSIVGSWEMEEFHAEGKSERDVSDEGFTLMVEADGQLSAKICNSMGGEYAIADGKITVSPLTSTLMFCTGVPGDVEVAFTQGLDTGLMIEGTGNALTLTAASGDRFTYSRTSTVTR